MLLTTSLFAIVVFAGFFLWRCSSSVKSTRSVEPPKSLVAPKGSEVDDRRKKATVFFDTQIDTAESSPRRYKQYHQQMQMVVSSFETVAGLNDATPSTSLAVKSVSKHFRRLKNAISDELHQVSKLLGEELMSSPSSSSRGSETMITPRLKYIDQSLRKQRGSENNCLGFLDNNQPMWRP